MNQVIFTADNKFTKVFIKNMQGRFAKNTIDGYENAIHQFLNYCDRYQFPKSIPFDTQTICDYIEDVAPYYKPSNIRQFISALSSVQKRVDIPDNENTAKFDKVRDALIKAFRDNGHRVKKAKALVYDKLREILINYVWSGNQTELRDKAMILLGFYGAMRRNEIIKLRYEDVEFIDNKGFSIYIKFSKTDQSAKGSYKAIPFNKKDTFMCPVIALNRFLHERGRHKSFLFTGITKGEKWTMNQLTGKGFDFRFKKYFPGYSSHSLRAGFITTAFQKNSPVHSIMNQVGHKNSNTTFDYNRPENIWIDNAVNNLIK